MDNYAMVPIWLLEKRVSGNAVIVYALLASYGHFSTGELRYVECRPAMATLVSRTGLSETTIRRAMDELLAVGAIVRHRRRTDNGGDVPSMYEVIFRRPRGVPTPGDPPTTDGVPPPPPVGEELEPDTKSSASLRSAGGAAAPAAEKIETARTILADWIDYLTKIDVKLPSVHRARYGQTIKKLLDDGYEPRMIKHALAKMTADNAVHRPALLPEVIVKIQIGPEVRDRAVTRQEAEDQRRSRAAEHKRTLIRLHGRCPRHADQPAGTQDGVPNCLRCRQAEGAPPVRPELVAGMSELAASFGTG